ncbi:FMRFamide receptor-like [Argonauta hians]
MELDSSSNMTIAPDQIQYDNDSAREALKMTRFIVQKILSPTVSTIGFIGNSLSIIVLSRRRMQSSTNVYLTALSVCDLLYLFFMLTLNFVHCSYREQPRLAFYYMPYARVLTDLFGNMAVWLTVSFTVERYVGVRYPMKGRIWCTVHRAKMISFLVFIVCLINTSPEFFEMEILEQKLSQNNQTVVYLVCNNTKLAYSDTYQIGYYWWFVSFFTFIPMILLSVFNSLLIRIVWKSSVIRKTLANSNVTGQAQRHGRGQNRITIMLINVVVIFLVCQLPWTGLLLYRTYMDAYGIRVRATILKILGNIANLMVQMNAASNFFLYSFFSSEFRQTLRNLLSCDERRHNSIVVETTITGTPIRRPLFAESNSNNTSSFPERAYSTFH